MVAFVLTKDDVERVEEVVKRVVVVVVVGGGGTVVGDGGGTSVVTIVLAFVVTGASVVAAVVVVFLVVGVAEGEVVGARGEPPAHSPFTHEPWPPPAQMLLQAPQLDS